MIKIAEPKPKLHYHVKIECMLPATLTYSVFAETPEQAADMIKNMAPITVNHKLAGRREIKLFVYNAGTNMLRFLKNLVR